MEYETGIAELQKQLTECERQLEALEQRIAAAQANYRENAGLFSELLPHMLQEGASPDEIRRAYEMVTGPLLLKARAYQKTGPLVLAGHMIEHDIVDQDETGFTPLVALLSHRAILQQQIDGLRGDIQALTEKGSVQAVADALALGEASGTGVG